MDSDLLSQKLISAIGGAGIVLFCESEYSCFKLFKRRTTFFFVCQLAIWSSALGSSMSISVYFLSNLRVVLPMLVIITIVRFVQIVSYPIMILIRLRFIHIVSTYLMYIPVILGIVLTALKYFWIHSILTNEMGCLYAYLTIQTMTTIIADFVIDIVINIVINIFFIVIAIKRFHNIVHIRCTVIVNIIVIILVCTVAIIEFAVIKRCFMPDILFCIIFIADQIKTRLEIEILSYTVQSAESTRQRLIRGEFLS